MNLSKLYKNSFLVIAMSLLLSACATQQKAAKIDSQIQGDVYTGSDTVEYLADGVPDRVFFATNESVLTTASRETLRKQAAWMRKNSDVTVVLEGHADERGTREYNMSLSAKRADIAISYLESLGVAGDRVETVPYGKERPVAACSSEACWSQNRRAVSVVITED